ncbi:Transposase, IS4 family protein, partial (plasmid) [Acidiphilium sp. PM]
MTQRRNRDGSVVTYYALAEAVWNTEAKRREARVIHSFGRADQLDRAALERLVRSINRVLGEDTQTGRDPTAVTAPPDIEIDAAFEFGIPLTARHLWEDLGIGPAVRDCLSKADLTAPHEVALFAMAANRLDDPGSKRACAERWLADTAWLPEATDVTVDQLYRALDVLAVWAEEIERAVFLRAADLLRLDVDLIFYDTTTA